MSVNTNWNINSYRTAYESDEHWALKRDFMEAHKSRFTESRLICLAQAFVNIELLGCKYPDRVMEQVAVLAKEVAKGYREKKKSRLQRTFVKASDAAGAKVKGYSYQWKTTSDEGAPSLKFTPSNRGPRRAGLGFGSAQDEPPGNRPSFNQSPAPGVPHGSQGTARDMRSGAARDQDTSLFSATQVHRPISEWCEFFERGDPLAEFVLVRHEYQNNNAATILNTSSGFCKIPVNFTYKEKGVFLECVVVINGVNVAIGKAGSKKKAKEIAVADALNVLTTRCFTLKVMRRHNEESVTMDQVANALTRSTPMDNPVSSSIGNKMMKMMGWTGGGLGKAGEGITEPIRPSEVLGREGLGHSEGMRNSVTPLFRKRITTIISEYAHSAKDVALAFSPEFSKDQRVEIHKISHRFNLKSASHGKESQRCLVLTKRVSAKHLLLKLLEEGSNDQYELIPPIRP